MDNEFNKLAKLLRTRLKIIADHEFREKDPDSHLEALKEISMAIENEYNVLEKSLEPRLKHYLYRATRKPNHIENNINN